MTKETPLLDHLISTMEAVVAAGRTLNIHMWFTNPTCAQLDDDPIPTGLNIHNCGTAACVVGYAVANLPHEKRSTIYHFIDELRDELGDYCLAHSIFAGNGRDDSLLRTKLSDDQVARLIGLNHIRRFNPTAGEALEYLRAVKEVINEV